MTSLSPEVSIEKAFAGSGSVTDEGVADERLCIRKVLSHDAETTQSNKSNQQELGQLRSGWVFLDSLADSM